ncbi:hypothetical protein Tco_0695235 [Tanacetum coccineum]
MVALLEKTDGSEGFHQIVDFLNASHIRFALSENPTIYDSHIKQFLVRETIRQEVEIPQSNFPTQTPVTDEAAFTCMDVVHGRAATTVSRIDAGQGSGNITKSPTMPHDSPLPGGHTPGSDEGSMTLHELTVLCTNLSNKVERLETELKQTKQTYGAAFTKLIKKVKKLEQTVKTSQARRRTKIIASDDEEDLGRYVQNLDSQEGFGAGPEVTTADTELNTASTFVSTASPQRYAYTTADDLTLTETLMEIRKSVAKAKGKAKIDETESPRKMKQRKQVQISRDAEVAQKLQEEFDASERQRMAQVYQAAQGFTDDEWDDVLARVAADEDFVQQLQAVPMVVDSYLDTKVEDVFQKELQKHTTDLIHKYSLQHLPELTKKPTPTAEQESEKSPSDFLKIKKE